MPRARCAIALKRSVPNTSTSITPSMFERWHCCVPNSCGASGRFDSRAYMDASLISRPDKDWRRWPASWPMRRRRGGGCLYAEPQRSIASLGITVNAVDPGATDTGWIPAELKTKLKAESPMGRIGTPEDAARIVRFLASPEAEWITGQVIHSRGGPSSRAAAKLSTDECGATSHRSSA